MFPVSNQISIDSNKSNILENRMLLLTNQNKKYKTLPNLKKSISSFDENPFKRLMEISQKKMKNGITQAGGPPPDNKPLFQLAKIIKKETNETMQMQSFFSDQVEKIESVSNSRIDFFKKFVVNLLIN